MIGRVFGLSCPTLFLLERVCFSEIDREVCVEIEAEDQDTRIGKRAGRIGGLKGIQTCASSELDWEKTPDKPTRFIAAASNCSAFCCHGRSIHGIEWIASILSINMP